MERLSFRLQQTQRYLQERIIILHFNLLRKTSFQVGYSDDTSTDSGSPWSFGSEGYRIQEGDGGAILNPTGNQVKMKIEAIPEPAVFALISLVGLGMIVARRFRS